MDFSFSNSIIPYPVRSYLFLGNKKCRIYAACGVSQTPILVKSERSQFYGKEKCKEYEGLWTGRL